MKILYPGGEKASFLNRNPTIRALSVAITDIAPHAPTQRLLYTCPANHYALVQSVYIMVNRKTAAAPQGEATEMLRFNDGVSTIIIWQTVEATNNLLLYRTIVPTIRFYLDQAQYLEIVTYDLSTGGTFDYFAGLQVIEFNR